MSAIDSIAAKRAPSSKAVAPAFHYLHVSTPKTYRAFGCEDSVSPKLHVVRVGKHPFDVPHHIHVEAYRYLRSKAVAPAFPNLHVSTPKTSPTFGCEDSLSPNYT